MKASDIEPLYFDQRAAARLHCLAPASERVKLAKVEGCSLRELFVSRLFLLGSVMFLLDAILENLKRISFSSLLHISASILFTIGSILFIPNDSQ